MALTRRDESAEDLIWGIILLAEMKTRQSDPSKLASHLHMQMRMIEKMAYDLLDTEEQRQAPAKAKSRRADIDAICARLNI